MANITVLGAGAWGSILASLAAANGHSVTVWSRRSPQSLSECLVDAEVIVSAVSMKGVRSVAQQVQAIGLPASAIVVTATKGLDPTLVNDRGLPLLPSGVWQETFPSHPVVVLSGPNLSKEIEQGLPTASVVAAIAEPAAILAQSVFSSKSFRVYTNDDPIGVELGGALKNVMAIAVGACDGLHLGTNAKAALITRGLAEIIRVGTYWGAKPETFYGLAGMGDLMATCSSPLSRNYQVGYGLAQGQTLAQVLEALTGTAEGVNTTPVLVKLAQTQAIALPISQQVQYLLDGVTTPLVALEALMQRDSKPEILPN